jgi:glycosyltransferase involved in cell wall biosynthesis
MKICIVAPHFYPETGGMETNILEVSKRLVKRGFEIDVHTSSRSTSGKMLKPAGDIDGISIFRYKPVFQFGYYATLIKPKFDEFDILHLHAYGYYAHNRLVSRYKNSPIVFTPHHGASMPRHGGFVEGLFHRYYEWSFGKRLKYISRVIMMTEAEKDWYIAHGLPEKGLIVIPSGVDENAFRRVQAEATLKKYGLDMDGYLLYLGRLHDEKSIDHLIEAFGDADEIFPELKLVIAGPDVGAGKSLKAYAKELGIKDKVVFTGRVNDDEKLALLGNCAVFTLPSKFEAEGVVLLEAMAQGRAVVASGVGGIPFIVKNGRTGILYKYGDIDGLSSGIRQLLESPEKREAYGKAAQAFVRKNYMWETIVDRMQKMYEEVSGSSAGD